MKIKKLPQAHDSVAMLVALVRMEGETSDGEEIFSEGAVNEGTYAIDSQGRIWVLEESLTMLFGGLKK